MGFEHPDRSWGMPVSRPTPGIHRRGVGATWSALQMIERQPSSDFARIGSRRRNHDPFLGPGRSGLDVDADWPQCPLAVTPAGPGVSGGGRTTIHDKPCPSDQVGWPGRHRGDARPHRSTSQSPHRHPATRKPAAPIKGPPPSRVSPQVQAGAPAKGVRRDCGRSRARGQVVQIVDSRPQLFSESRSWRRSKSSSFSVLRRQAVDVLPMTAPGRVDGDGRLDGPGGDCSSGRHRGPLVLPGHIRSPPRLRILDSPHPRRPAPQ